MARHPFVGTTLWGQPYGSPLEAWLLAPFFALAGATPVVLSCFYFALGLLLVPLAWRLGQALDAGAALPAALLAALAPAYVLLLAARPPPLYPLALLLQGLLLLLALRAGPRLARGEPPRGLLLAWGLVAGLALWTHLMSLAIVAAGLAWVARAALRAPGAAPRRPLAPLAWAGAALLGGSAPAWLPSVQSLRAPAVLEASRPRESAGEHLRSLLPRLHEPVGGVLGTHAPLLPDDAQHVVRAPAAVSLALAGAWLLLAGVLARGHRARRANAEPSGAALLALALALVLAAFVVPARSGAHTLRFLTPAFLPLCALGGLACARLAASRGWMVALALAALGLPASVRLHAAWHAADRERPPFDSPDLAPVLRVLNERGVGHAWASYAVAWRLTFESGETVIASQPWNERFRHEPLPLRDEVRFARDVAWVLTPGVPSDLPTPRRFEDALGALGGRFRRESAGAAVIYHDFAPPFGPGVELLPEAGAAGDGDLETRLEPRDARRELTLVLRPPRALDALTLLAGTRPPTLPRSLDLAVSADGREFEVVARRRRRGEREDLRWINGQPQAVLDHDVLTVALGGRTVAAVRLTPVDADEPWALAEILLHRSGQGPADAPWDDWLAPRLSWSERREALARSPRLDRADWYYRAQLAARH